MSATSACTPESVSRTIFAQLHTDAWVNIASGAGCIIATVISPFCIMLLYRYLLHYGLLLYIMSQYLCLFSLILQGLHEEGECWQLEFWAGKGANIRDLFCTTPKVLKLQGTPYNK